MEQVKRFTGIAFSREPAIWLGVIQALLGLAVGFGLPLSSEQVGLIMAFAAAIGALIVRQRVYAPTNVGGDRLEAVKYANQPLQAVEEVKK